MDITTTPITDPTPITRGAGERTWARWAAMWNGELDLAAAIIADGFTIHLTAPARVFGSPETLRDARAVAAWVAKVRGAYARLVYSTTAGPFVDLERGVVASPWAVDGVDAGRAFRKAGLDILRIRDGRIHEAWTISNEA
jgi:hypothetical protein